MKKFSKMSMREIFFFITIFFIGLSIQAKFFEVAWNEVMSYLFDFKKLTFIKAILAVLFLPMLATLMTGSFFKNRCS